MPTTITLTLHTPPTTQSRWLARIGYVANVAWFAALVWILVAMVHRVADGDPTVRFASWRDLAVWSLIVSALVLDARAFVVWCGVRRRSTRAVQALGALPVACGRCGARPRCATDTGCVFGRPQRVTRGGARGGDPHVATRG